MIQKDPDPGNSNGTNGKNAAAKVAIQPPPLTISQLMSVEGIRREIAEYINGKPLPDTVAGALYIGQMQVLLGEIEALASRVSSLAVSCDWLQQEHLNTQRQLTGLTPALATLETAIDVLTTIKVGMSALSPDEIAPEWILEQIARVLTVPDPATDPEVASQ